MIFFSFGVIMVTKISRICEQIIVKTLMASGFVTHSSFYFICTASVSDVEFLTHFEKIINTSFRLSRVLYFDYIVVFITPKALKSDGCMHFLYLCFLYMFHSDT
jgi:hypothetical protein